jgi:uncharacterized low-complexity protein
MNQKHLKKLALGAAIAGSLAAVPAAQASPFSLITLGSAYMAADGDASAKKPDAEMKCGEGKCGAKKEGEKQEDEKQEGGKQEGGKQEGEKKPE